MTELGPDDDVRTWLHAAADAIDGPPASLRGRILDEIAVKGMLAAVDETAFPPTVRERVENALFDPPDPPVLVAVDSPAFGRRVRLRNGLVRSPRRWYPWGAAAATTIAIALGLVVLAREDERRTPPGTTPSAPLVSTASTGPPPPSADDGVVTPQSEPGETATDASPSPASTDLSPVPPVTSSSVTLSSAPSTSTPPSTLVPGIPPPPPTESLEVPPEHNSSPSSPTSPPGTASTIPSTVSPPSTVTPSTAQATTTPPASTSEPPPPTTLPASTSEPPPPTTLPPVTAPTYACAVALDVGIGSAVLRGLTTDPAASGARFELTPPDGTISLATAVTLENGIRIMSTVVVGLSPNTSYTYRVTFLGQNDRVLGASAAGGCQFTTRLL